MATTTFILGDDPGENVGTAGLQVQVTLTEITVDGFTAVQVTLDALPGTQQADLRGYFFDISTNTFFNSLTATGTHVTTFENDGTVSNLGGGANINGSGEPDEFEIGVQIGTAGASPDFIDSTTFVLSVSGVHFSLSELIGQGVAIRATSVDDPATTTIESGSSKLFGTVPPPGVAALNIVKEADAGQTADVANELIAYTITVQNTGTQTLTGVTVTDPYADAGSIVRGTDLFGDNDALLEIGETWSYTAAHTVTQAELDSNGGGNGLLENTATADSDQTGPDTDDATVPLVYAPSYSIDKTVTDVGGGGAAGSGDAAGDVIAYQIVVTNDGNITITVASVSDPLLGALTQTVGNDDDGILNVGETWTYTGSYTVTQADLDGKGGGDGDIDNTATVVSYELADESDSEFVPLVYNPDLEITKTAALPLADADGKIDSPADDISYTVKVKNTGNITLTGVVLNDSLLGVLASYTPSINNDGDLDVGETWTYTATYNVLQSDIDNFGAIDGLADNKIKNTATVDTNETAPESASADVLIDNHFFNDKFVKGLTKGFWGQHMEAWDGGTGTNTNRWDKLVGTDLTMKDVLIQVDSDGNGGLDSTKGILLGDVNANGLTDTGETTLFVSLAAAKSIILSSDSATDTRQILMSQALAAQLNINNLSGDYLPLDTTNAEGPNNIVTEAALWLRGTTPYIYNDNSTDAAGGLKDSSGKVDANDNGILESGEYVSSAFTFDGNGTVLNGTALTSNLQAWQKAVGVDTNTIDNLVKADGEGLKNALEAFNMGKLVVSSDGGSVGWFNGTGVIDVQANTVVDAFWDVLEGRVNLV